MTAPDRHGLRIGARFPNAGSAPARIGLASAARRLEAAGFDSLWTSDHLAMPATTRSVYPFTSDGEMPWSPDLGWSDAIVSLGVAAAVTERIELGTAVLVAPLRSPLVMAMQVASVSVEAGGRCVLGVGAGWLVEEFEAVNVPFAGRGQRLDSWIEVVRQVWSGTLPRRTEGPYPNPAEMVCRPLPVEPVPVLVGGLSAAAQRRAGRLGDGWLALQSVDELDPASLADSIESVRRHAENAGRDGSTLRFVLQITGSKGLAEKISGRLAELGSSGIDEVIVDVDWDSPDEPRRTHDTLREAAAGVGSR